MSNFRQVDRDTGFLLPPSVDEWLPEKHLARFVTEVVEGSDLRAMTGDYRGSGSASYHPTVLLGILVYGYATGVFSSRKLERATYDSVAFRFIAANDHPDHDTIAAFRRRFLKEIQGLFVQVLLLAREMGMLQIGTVGLDGTKIHIADIASRTAGKEINMAKDTHVTAPTRFIEANGIRYAYRRFGSESGTPLVFLQHFRGGLDNWDPLVTDGLAQGRPVILFNNAGVASSSGETPNTIEAMGDHVAAFVNALGLPQVDVLGFSIGGYVAQSFVLRHPNLVRRLVLAGTGPRNGEPSKNSRVLEVAGNPVPVCEDFLFLFFSPSEASQAAGRAFWDRRHQRKDADPPSSIQTMKAQQAAIMEWREPRGERYADLNTIKQPTLVVNGNDDIMVPTINSFTLSQHVPNAQLIVYPDSGHGALFQYPELFVAHTNLFLDQPSARD